MNISRPVQYRPFEIQAKRTATPICFIKLLVALLRDCFFETKVSMQQAVKNLMVPVAEREPLNARRCSVGAKLSYVYR